MSYADHESSQHAGEPVDCYLFSHGVDVWRITSAAEPHTLTDGTYVPEAITGSSIRRSREWDSGKLTVTLDYLHPIARLFQLTRPRQPVTLKVYNVHRDEPEEVVRFNGEVQQAQSTGRTVILECVPLTYRFRKRIPQLIYASKCPLALYGPRCGVDRTAFGELMGVASITAATLTAPPLGGQIDGWWVNGYVQTLAGETRFIIGHSGNDIVLEYPLDVVPGEQITVYPGCDRTEATCRDKFSNLPNHLGFARIPVKELFGKGIQ